MSCPYRDVICVFDCSFLSMGDKFLHDKIYEECPVYQKEQKELKNLTITYRTRCPGSVFLRHQTNEKEWWEIKKEQLEEIGHKVDIIMRLSY